MDRDVAGNTHSSNRAAGDDRPSTDELFPMVYGELRDIARRMLGGAPPGNTLQATALVNEAYLRLNSHGQLRAESKEHFVRIAARAMRFILVDRCRAKTTRKKRPGGDRVPLEAVQVAMACTPEHVLAVHEALEVLQQRDPELVELVELRFFVGLSNDEIANTQGTSVTTTKRRWSTARAWLIREMEDSEFHARGLVDEDQGAL